MDFSTRLDENIARYQEKFQGNCMVVFRYLENTVAPHVRGIAIFSDGLVGASLVNDYVIKPFLANTQLPLEENKLHFLRTSVFQSNDVVTLQNEDELYQRLFSGDVIFFLDGYANPLAVNARFPATRSISEPENEKTLKGPREGFGELILFNTALIMRRLKNEHLKLENFTLGTKTKTTVIMAYIEGVCPTDFTDNIRNRLTQMTTDGLTDTNQLAELLKDNLFSPFKTAGSTERPDVVCHKLMEGRIAILADGTPQVITLPFLFHEYFSSTDDYSVNFYYGSISRLIRYLSFLIALFLPAIYLSAVKFQLEILPEKLLYSISISRTNVPFSATMELLVFLLFFEILREASTRTPSAIGQTLSIAGALILGQTAVEANFISVPAIIIVAISGLCTNVLPQMRGPLILIRFAILIVASFLGIYGVVLSAIVLLIHLSDMNVAGENYLKDMAIKPSNLMDIYIRGPYRFLRENHQKYKEK